MNISKFSTQIKKFKITPKIVLKVLFWILLLLLYHLTELGNRWATNARGGMWMIGDSGIPYATLPGVFTFPMPLMQ